jgi:hypothetical protein
VTPCSEPRVPSVGSTLDLAIERSPPRSLLRSREVPRTLSPEAFQFACHDERPLRATPHNLGSPRGSPRRLGEDASCRPLQPTYYTSTRGSLDFRARSSHRADRQIPPRPVRAGFFLAASDRLAAIQPRLGLRLTARLQLRSSRFMAPWPSGSMDTRHLISSGATLAWRCRPSTESAIDL